MWKQDIQNYSGHLRNVYDNVCTDMHPILVAVYSNVMRYQCHIQNRD